MDETYGQIVIKYAHAGAEDAAWWSFMDAIERFAEDLDVKIRLVAVTKEVE